MSITIKNEDITKEISSVIAEYLTFTKVYDPYRGDHEAPKQVSCYELDYIQNKKVTVLPFYFGMFITNRFNISPVWQDYSPSHINIKFEGSLLEYQTPLLVQLLSNLQTHKASLLAAHPGAGKTVMSVYTIATIRMVTLIVICFRFQYVQFSKTITKFTNAKISTIADKEIDPDADIYICTIQSLHKIPPDIRSKIGFLIVDEFHLFYTQVRVTSLLGIKCKYMLGLTATPDGDEMCEIHKAFLGPSRVIKPFDRPFEVHAYHTMCEPLQECNVRGKLNYTKYVKSLLYNKQRNQFITYNVVNNPSRKVLVLTFEKAHVDEIYDILFSMGEPVSKYYSSMTTYQDKRILVGTVSKIGTAFDEETFCENFLGTKLDLLIMCCSYRKLSAIEQTCGRILRASRPYVLYLIDDGGTSVNHWKVFRPWSRKIGATVKEYHIDLREGYKDANKIQAFHDLKVRGVPENKEGINLYPVQYTNIYSPIK